MSKNANQTRLFRALIARLAPEMRRAFMQAMQDLRDGIDYEAFLRALADNNVDAAIAALNIEPAAFHVYVEQMKSTFAAGGTLAATTVNPPAGVKIAFRFDMANERAETWIRRNVAERVIVEAREQVENVRSAILSGYSKGKHPSSIALDVVGRIDGGKRTGGVLGLDPHRAGHRDRMRMRLESGEPSELRKILDGMSLRDKRLDGRIKKAIRDGTKISQADIDLMVQRYSDRLLKRRAEDIARTETGSAVMSGRNEEWNQALDKLGKPADAVIKTWRAGGGVKDPRQWHQDMDGVKVRGLRTPFLMATGVQMQHALDMNGGAKECANCSCGTDFRIDHSWGLK